MEENMRKNCYGNYKENVCDIESVCCTDFVKEQFSLKTIARNTVVIVYQSTVSNDTRGTIKIKNLSSNTAINFTVNSTNIVVQPNQEAAITASNLTTVTVQSIGVGSLALVKLCFDLQVRALAN
ncbi:MAG: DUF3992 domain-containing protein [Clostridium sp.]|uniref:S-Ena type endospore appendage n=1 Tax=Clostridium sp. TaxID=1506 RepID=UPI002FC7A28E